MEQVFIINSDDRNYCKKFKQEANIVLASLDYNTPEYHRKLHYFKKILKVIEAIENTYIDNYDDTEFILSTVTKIFTTGILSPLTLNDDEFEPLGDKMYADNIRYPHIYRDRKGRIYNNAAYKLLVKRRFDANEGIEVYTTPYSPGLYNYNKIHIYKGGIITGEYLGRCEIRKDVIDKHSFTIQSIINIPVIELFSGNSWIYAADHREPKLKVLREFYEVPIHVDEGVKSKHYDIRKFVKLKK